MRTIAQMLHARPAISSAFRCPATALMSRLCRRCLLCLELSRLHQSVHVPVQVDEQGGNSPGHLHGRINEVHASGAQFLVVLATVCRLQHEAGGLADQLGPALRITFGAPLRGLWALQRLSAPGLARPRLDTLRLLALSAEAASVCAR